MTDDLHRLEVSLGRAAARVVPESERALKRGAQGVKEKMADAFADSGSFRGAARSVSYDRKGVFGSIGFEIGPTVGGAGSLADIAVNGGANGGGGSVDIDTAVRGEVEATERFLGEILDGLL